MSKRTVIGSAKLSVLHALLGMVIPSLRGVAIEISPTLIEIYFYHDGKLNDEIEDHYSCVETESSCDYYYNNKSYLSDFKIIRLNYPKKLPSRHDHWVYKRAEPFVDPK